MHSKRSVDSENEFIKRSQIFNGTHFWPLRVVVGVAGWLLVIGSTIGLRLLAISRLLLIASISALILAISCGLFASTPVVVFLWLFVLRLWLVIFWLCGRRINWFGVGATLCAVLKMKFESAFHAN